MNILQVNKSHLTENFKQLIFSMIENFNFLKFSVDGV